MNENENNKKLESLVISQWGLKDYLLIIGFIGVLSITGYHLKLDFINLVVNASKYFFNFMGRIFPPDFSGAGVLILSMIETIEIAIWGTFIAVVLSLPMGFFSARNIAPNYVVYLISRIITVFFRAIPEFILAMFLVISVGFGAMSGIFALGLHTMGFLAKFYAEAIEHVEKEPINALIATGAKKSQVIMYAVVPQVLHAFIANNLYILDRNVRMATMLGIVGAGGIGYELISSFRMFRYTRVTAIIIIIFIAIFIIDYTSGLIRKKLTK